MGAGHGGNPWRATQLLALALVALFATGVVLERVRTGMGATPPQHASVSTR
jgi:hypothetical protein